MAYKYITLPKAEKDIDKAVTYYADIKKSLAKRFSKELKEKVKYITQKPEHIQIRYDNVRMAHLKTFPYSIHFVFENNTIIILAVFAFKEDSEKWTQQ